jgi:hypothetical protein
VPFKTGNDMRKVSIDARENNENIGSTSVSFAIDNCRRGVFARCLHRRADALLR